VTNGAGCIGYDSVKVSVFYTGYDLFVPSAFSPNNDGRNDVFQVTAPGLVELKSFIIYNRWGQLVFSSNNISKGWDGKINGQPAAAGVYVWFISGRFLDNKVMEKKGTLVLVK
jgi:gliding motility-associated-like protein